MELITIKRQVNFELRKSFMCPQCHKKNQTERVINTFENYNENDHSFTGTCQFCGGEFKGKGRPIIQQASIPKHSACRCGRHFLFHLERDVRAVKFSPIGSPYIECPYCRRRFLLFTPLTPFKFYINLLIQNIVDVTLRKSRALKRSFALSESK